PGGVFSFFSDPSETAEVQKHESGSSTSPSLKDILQSPTHRRITIGDRSYELFTQPAGLPELTFEQKADPSPRLILAGLVETKTFQSEYRAIPHTWLLLFLFFVLLGLLSLPILHLGFMDSHERLSRIHVLSLLVACVSGTALITLFFLDVVWLSNVRDRLDNQLKVTAETIQEVFASELKKTWRHLVAFDRSDHLKADFNCVTEEQTCPDKSTGEALACVEKGNRKCGGDSKDDRWVARKEYQNLYDAKRKKVCPDPCSYNPVFWVDQDKNARITWTTDSEDYYFETSKVSLAHREYVKRILGPEPQSSLWRINDDDPEFYAQSLSSLGSGRHMVVLSMTS
ncbi:MAG: hypothetical protein MJA29_13225, partial [Candidatus Omnitrophica bacterium]|nr:hypothetical protein [Candidatus Omnitrophota bacterium]